MKRQSKRHDQPTDALGQALGRALANEFALYVATRGAHWNVTGLQFGALHALFEQQYEALDEIIDELAERLRALGHRAPATLGGYAKSCTIEDAAGEASEAKEMLAGLLAGHEALARELLAAADLADEADDSVSEDFLVSLAERHQKMAWMLRAHLS
ncbi:MAG: DNA starvation/stationary phase protection protein [Casimicrobiaceae bacterium]|nr:DNA starvation/stationary phase protection protein [Casimicrobiaceae bacterium]MCX8098404.1 DNA starvation/stationary phase protection protein [Casimicrobiaceae bacterium]MDW8311116.1 DNA starvation/stationary phase protection protein [Burkholderiales bacterium]